MTKITGRMADLCNIGKTIVDTHCKDMTLDETDAWLRAIKRVLMTIEDGGIDDIDEVFIASRMARNYAANIIRIE